MEFRIKDLDLIIKKTESIADNFKPLVNIGFNELTERFKLDVKINQMSGRPGLNEITGNLKARLLTRTKSLVRSVKSSIYNNAVYWNVHQYGYSPRNIPKRLHVIELMRDEYELKYLDSVEKAFNRASEK